MKLLVATLAEHGFHGPFRGESSAVVDRTGHPVLIVNSTVKLERGERSAV